MRVAGGASPPGVGSQGLGGVEHPPGMVPEQPCSPSPHPDPPWTGAAGAGGPAGCDPGLRAEEDKRGDEAIWGQAPRRSCSGRQEGLVRGEREERVRLQPPDAG